MLTDNQREALIAERGTPKLTLEFDVFDGNKVSMWTHFDHAADYDEMKAALVAIKEHLEEFLKDGRMCPFCKTKPE
jgi:hypothetical protein